MSAEQLHAALARLADARVLCVGDVMLDRFVYGAVDRISPEAPIPVLKVDHEAAMLGGAGNVVRNMAALGARSAFVSVIGADAAGTEIETLLGGMANVEASLVSVRGRGTTIKTRYVAAGQQLLRADRESDGALDAPLREAILRRAQAALDGSRVLALSDYGKGVLGHGIAGEIIAAARTAGCVVIVDPKGSDYARYRGASLITPNARELAQATGLPTGNDEEIVAAARKLIADFGIDAVLATRSGEGMSLVRKDTCVHVRAQAREVFDVAGAGDTVVATMAVALAAGVELEIAARLANFAAGIVVGKLGTAVASVEELHAAIEQQDLAAPAPKLMTLDQAVARAARWRDQGLSVGFTNGCFDLLHPGHVSLLRQARAACDRLIVGLNSDASVKRLKGNSRPVQNETARAAVLASLADVDALVLFAQDTPVELIAALRPQLLVKGADYTEAQVVGGEQVKAWGGRILLAELSPGHSTTGTIRNLTTQTAKS
jgi:D-beta-D-heptose 7-phosphate kinase/D-beta-D-heptose 1-phosphate adenosyltransferase